jgi:hypothetical protein
MLDHIALAVLHHVHYVHQEHTNLVKVNQVAHHVQVDNIKDHQVRLFVAIVEPEHIVLEELLLVLTAQPVNIKINLVNHHVIIAQPDNIKTQLAKHHVKLVDQIHIVLEEHQVVQTVQVDIVVLQVQQLLTIVGDIDIHKFIRLEKQQVVVVVKDGVIQLAWDYVQMLLVGIMDQEHVQ